LLNPVAWAICNLKTRIGDDQLGEYVKIMELTLLVEAWLKKDEFTEDELHVFNNFIPYYIHMFTSTINQMEGNEMKLIKIICYIILQHDPFIWL